jgi:hypothetical protein
MRANTLEIGLALIFVTTVKIRDYISSVLVVEAPMPRVTQTCDRAAALASFLPGDQIARCWWRIADRNLSRSCSKRERRCRGGLARNNEHRPSCRPASVRVSCETPGRINCRSKARRYSRADPLRSLEGRGHTRLSHCSEQWRRKEDIRLFGKWQRAYRRKNTL